MNLNLDALQMLYLITAIGLLAVAILLYPTLRDRSNGPPKKK